MIRDADIKGAHITTDNDNRITAVGKFLRKYRIDELPQLLNILTGDMVREGATVIDVGMNRNAEGKLCGDVDFESVKQVAGAITPVPGGVGPMTITMLLMNTLESAQNTLKSAY